MKSMVKFIAVVLLGTVIVPVSFVSLGIASDDVTEKTNWRSHNKADMPRWWDQKDDSGQEGSRAFYKQKYDEVVAELKSLGEIPQTYLKKSGFASRWQGKEVKGQPYWVGEITAYMVPSRKLTDDEVHHLLALSNTFLSNIHMVAAEQAKGLREALIKMFDNLSEQSFSKVLKNRMAKFLTELRGLNL